MNERDIFIAALHQRDPAERAALLNSNCAGDQALRDRIEELLREQEQLGSFLERPAAGLGETGAYTPQASEAAAGLSEKPGTIIGSYKLLEQIGEGGFGVVFMAEQQQPLRRKVALKILKPGMDTRQVVARFEAERQALALMDHPHIAHVFDGGETATGRPYFVMELVRGIAIIDFCDQNRLSIRERLELFVNVCQAVQHAHQKGIIHRDIKPSNVLVTLHDGTPVVKVIDFGIAKATGQQLTDKTLFTHFAQMVGTPLYMSPEQAGMSGLDVDTRSDIYSLGVLLYELLTGTTPFDREHLRSASYDEIRRIIREEEPPRPSTRINTLGQAAATVSVQRQSEPKQLSRLIRGELDWIIMKALEKDRNRRYETAIAFAADVQHYLHDEPVQACPPSAAYRFGKFARRNKGRLAAAALLLFLLASLGGVAAWAALQHRAQRKALETDIVRDLDEVRNFCRDDRLREASAVLDHAQALAARGGAGDELGRQVAQMRTDVNMAALLETIHLDKATVKDEHFDETGAAPRYAEAFRDYGIDVDVLDAEEAAARIQVSEIREQLIAALDNWLIPTPKGNRKRLLDVLVRVDADLWRQQLRAAFVEWNPKALRALASDANATGQPPSAAALMGRALRTLGEVELAVEFLRRAHQEHPSDFWLNQNLGHSLTYLKTARPGEAVGYLRAALGLRPKSPGVLVNLGLALDKQGDLPGALAAYRRAIALKPDHAAAHNNLGNVLKQQGDLPGAVAAYRKAIALKPDLPIAHYNLGAALRDKGDLAGAIAASQKAIDLKPNYAEAYCKLGAALEDKGDLPGAIAACRKAIALKPDYALAHNNLSYVLRKRGDLAGAIAASQKAIALKPDYASAYCNLGVALSGKGDLPGAVAAYQKAIALKPDCTEAHNGLGVVLLDKDDRPGALAAFQKTIALKPEDAMAHNNLGNVLRRQGDLPGAVAAYRKAIALKPDLAAVHRNLGAALRDKGDLPGAIAAFQKAIALQPDYVPAYCSLGAALRKQGDLPGAFAAWRKAIALKPDYAEAHIYLGNVLSEQGDLASAIAAYRKAIALKPDDAAAHFNLGIALLCKDDFPGARAALEKAIALKPDLALAHYSLGNVLCNQGDWSGAVAAYRKVIALKPDYAEAHVNLGFVLAKKGQADEAIACYKKAIALNPKLAEAHNSLGRALMGKGQVDDAIACCKKALALKPKSATLADASVNLARLYQQQGNWAAAKSLLLEGRPHHLAVLKAKPRDPTFRRLYHDHLCVLITVHAVLLEKEDAVRTAETYGSLGWNAPLDAYNAACYLCRCIPIAAKHDKLDDKQRKQAVQFYGDAAMKLLGEAVSKGYRNATFMKKDRDLDPLRQREDFRKLLDALLRDEMVLAQARNYILRSQWDKAAAEYAKTDLWARPLREDAYANACLFLNRGDSEGYTRFYQDMIQRVAQTASPYEAYVLARSCVITRKSPVDAARAVQWASLAADKYHKAWNFHVLGLAQYRAGRFDQALQSLTKAQNLSYELNWFGLALVHHRLGHSDEAQRCWDKGIQWLEKNGPPSAEQPAKMHPMDWLEVQFLRREAEEMLKIKRSP